MRRQAQRHAAVCVQIKGGTPKCSTACKRTMKHHRESFGFPLSQPSRTQAALKLHPKNR